MLEGETRSYKKQSSFAGAKAKARLGDRRSVIDYDYAQRQLIDQNARTYLCRGLQTAPVDSHRGGGGRDRAEPVKRHRNTGGRSERVALFLFCVRLPLLV